MERTLESFSSGEKTVRMLVTVLRAKEWLQNNSLNRKVDRGRVDRYANDMTNGKWRIATHEYIKICTNGSIADGQHRLLAIVKSGIPVIFDVVLNYNEANISILDSGKSRSAGDVFTIYHIKNSTSVAAVIKFEHAVKNNTCASRMNVLSSSDAMEILETDHDFYQFIAAEARRLSEKFSGALPAAWIGGFYAHLYKISKDDAKSFIEQLTIGGMVENNAIILLRKILADNMKERKKLVAAIKFNLIKKAWNYFRSGISPSRLVIGSTETVIINTK